jgi:diguanylate cyclase (GGDEF)-like protein
MKAYAEALERAGFVVVGVSGGVAALVSLQRTRPHVVIADENLRDIRAEELARNLGQTQDGLPLIMIGAGDATGTRRSAALSVGAFDYISVPAEQALLLARTAQLVALRRTMERLRAEADRDYLTGLANRRRFRTALGQEVERWRRYNVPCALLLVDIDFLKKVNDAHGHSAGDVVIRHVASALVELSRDNDTAARLGGEEFALLLAGADDAKAIAAAERLRFTISHEPLEGIGTVTVSLGVASCPSHAGSERTLYAASDAALYRAKEEGRNCSIVASPLAAS